MNQMLKSFAWSLSEFFSSFLFGLIPAVFIFFSETRRALEAVAANRYLPDRMFTLLLLRLGPVTLKIFSLAFGFALVLVLIKARCSAKKACFLRSVFGRVPVAAGAAVFLVLLSVGIGYGGVSVFNRPQGPNVIVLLVDALRSDHLGVYGYSRPTSPNIDRFARQARVYQGFSQCSWTNPSIASFFTALYPSTHGVQFFAEEGQDLQADVLPRRLLTLAEMFKSKGYATGAFVANHWIGPRLNFDQGFDLFDPISENYKPRAQQVNEKALAWIHANRERPFFAYLHYMDVHGPYEPPEPFRSLFNTTGIKRLTKGMMAGIPKQTAVRYMIDCYDGEIAYTDSRIGLLFAELDKMGLRNNTVIVFLADHGEAFLEHGYGEHGWSLYGEEINVPVILKTLDGRTLGVPAGQRVEVQDVSRTLLSLIGAESPYPAEGWDLSRPGNESLWRSREMYSEQMSRQWKGPPQVALVQKERKAIYALDEKAVTEIYDLARDPGERENLAGEERELSQVKKASVERHLTTAQENRKKLGLEKESVRIDDEETIDQLRSLGYLQ